MRATLVKIQLSAFLILIVLACKPKTELYLERGLDILSNKKEINFKISDSILIKEFGIIRDQKEYKKTLVFKLDNTNSKANLVEGDFLGIRVWIEDDKGKIRKENWDFQPSVTIVKNHKYILNEINIKEDKIKRMKIYMFQLNNGRKKKTGDSLVINKVNTYND